MQSTGGNPIVRKENQTGNVLTTTHIYHSKSPQRCVVNQAPPVHQMPPLALAQGLPDIATTCGIRYIVAPLNEGTAKRGLSRICRTPAEQVNQSRIITIGYIIVAISLQCTIVICTNITAHKIILVLSKLPSLCTYIVLQIAT